MDVECHRITFAQPNERSGNTAIDCDAASGAALYAARASANAKFDGLAAHLVETLTDQRLRQVTPARPSWTRKQGAAGECRCAKEISPAKRRLECLGAHIAYYASSV
ncbi:hypothetical protein GCM10011329_11220 [Stakelama pacifica]|nr:hypothetical protein GCM10011329_11220 [Stakelama pacifica]